ncbi:hypothetical protein [uncultured Clostridium sp.]|uniref:hypothetical protein n=1 Tax=uncultured Clostridium sp. TaxID=59620 RepID=UPI0025F835B2|nr:hypothetical protein [uncultured Clostridium sp.]
MTKKKSEKSKTKKCSHCGKSLGTSPDSYYTHTNLDESEVYYCDRDHYETNKRKIRYEKNIKAICHDIFKCSVSYYSLFRQELKILQEVHDLESICKYLEENSLDIDVAMSMKGIEEMKSKILYFFAIVREGMDKYNQMVIESEKSDRLNKEIEISEKVKFVPKKKKKTLAEILSELD